MTRILVIFSLLLGQTLGAFPFIDGIPDEYFSDSTYVFLYLFFFNFLVEISLIIVVSFKQSSIYVANHSFINFSIIIGQFLNDLLFYLKNQEKLPNPLFYGSASLTAISVLQIWFGLSLDKRLRSQVLVKKIFILRFLHRNAGRLLYIGHKVIVYVYFYRFLLLKNFDPMVAAMIIATIFIVTIGLQVALFIIRRVGLYPKPFEGPYLISTSQKKEVYKDIINNVEMNLPSGEMESSVTIRNETLPDLSESVGDNLIYEGQKLLWVVIEDKLYDLTGYRHPKGNYILKGIAHNDITREIFGLKSYFFEDRKNRFLKILTHKHNASTIKMLEKVCVRYFMLTPLLIRELLPGEEGDIASQKSGGSRGSGDALSAISSINLIRLDEPLLRRRIRETFDTWRVEGEKEICPDASLLYFKKIQEDVMVNISVWWLHIFGKYFIAKLNTTVEALLYPAISLSTKYLQEKEEWLRANGLDPSEHISNLGATLTDAKFLDYRSTSLVYEKLKQGSKDIKDKYLPLLHVKKNSKKSRILQELSLVGPLGFGMGFNDKFVGLVLIVIEDQHIFPFLDFLEFLSQKALVERTKSKTPHPIFTSNDYLISFANEFKVSFYWKVSEKFSKFAENHVLPLISSISKSYMADSEDSPVKKLLSQFVICSNIKRASLPVLKITNSPINNFPDLERLMKSNAPEERTELLVCGGADKFLESFLKTVTVEPGRIRTV